MWPVLKHAESIRRECAHKKFAQARDSYSNCETEVHLLKFGWWKVIQSALEFASLIKSLKGDSPEGTANEGKLIVGDLKGRKGSCSSNGGHGGPNRGGEASFTDPSWAFR
jgi:hypothetical protein